MYSKKTRKINITVNPYFLDDQSEPDEQHFVWAYQVTIDNQGNETSLDYERMVKIVKKHNFSGYIGVEYGGGEYGGIPMSDPEGTIATRDLLKKLI